MKDQADYARKGIARGRSLAALEYDDGILLCAENPSSTLHKVAEIYDRIAFAGVGKYNEFDQLRKFGVRTADLTGYQFSREDVNANSLANQYAQILGNVFTHEMKPLEVEILVAEVGATAADDQLFHILYDGTVMDEDRFSVLGGEAEAIAERLEAAWQPGLDLGRRGGRRRQRPGRPRADPHRRRPRGGGARARRPLAGPSAASPTPSSSRSLPAGPTPSEPRPRRRPARRALDPGAHPRDGEHERPDEHGGDEQRCHAATSPAPAPRRARRVAVPSRSCRSSTSRAVS